MKSAPCRGCGKRAVGCHAGCGEYLEWRKAYERQKAENHVERPEMSRQKELYIWREMKRR